ncbi:hypothetical protein LJC25_01370 [Bacteroidales bacterium OttesenSCG-928-K03]|nr:hypothetical protein [Odoribacter sp. OttesenSCG-928-L07]MDL2239368.1 hypothetical protein [Bacteroidales bacterium OttesenSCG-928-L14]MDL2240583.1 hypothetical protein [Bacteroidales bacterium OttesenSCG-928-K22]MDL2242356.1 hypothetical protein [Bacteroidales bacterium OttesenSCG-928-K03]
MKKNGTKYNAKYFVGDEISFKYCDNDICIKVRGKINVIEDDIIIVNYSNEYEISKITKVFVDRRVIQLLQPAVGGAGAIYLGLTGINALITQEGTEMSTADYVVPISLMAAAAAVTPLNKRKYHLDKPWKYSLTVLDFDE